MSIVFETPVEIPDVKDAGWSVCPEPPGNETTLKTAKGSTLFLDEIGELPIELQAKLLRVLESGEFERLGSSRTLHSDARIIAATNRVLEEDEEARHQKAVTQGNR